MIFRSSKADNKILLINNEKKKEANRWLIKDSSKFEKDYAFIVNIEVDVMAALVGDDRGEALSHEAVPVGAIFIHCY
jgi:hypothetical protein